MIFGHVLVWSWYSCYLFQEFVLLWKGKQLCHWEKDCSCLSIRMTCSQHMRLHVAFRLFFGGVCRGVCTCIYDSLYCCGKECCDLPLEHTEDEFCSVSSVYYSRYEMDLGLTDTMLKECDASNDMSNFFWTSINLAACIFCIAYPALWSFLLLHHMT